jgi:hypothetical protein
MRIPAMIAVTLAALLSLGSRAASAQTCTSITSLPYTINAAGRFCLTGDLSYSNGAGAAPAITVDHDSVVLDFNGYRLLYNGTSPSSNDGVQILSGHPGVVVRNGVISSFLTAIETSSGGTIVEDMRPNLTGYGVIVQFGAAGVVIRHNQFRTMTWAAVATFGNATRVLDNDIEGKDAASSQGVIVEGLNAFVVGNRMNQLSFGVAFNSAGTGKYRDNLTGNVGTSYSGGTSAGNNN